MKIIISPAKTLDFETPPQTKISSAPQFEKEAAELAAKLKKLSTKKIAKLMDLSEKLAQLNFERFQSFGQQPRKQAVLAYMGDVYTGLCAWEFSAANFKFAQNHLYILSGLYGLLRPLDLIEPYRLEMSTGINLYKFWGDKLTKVLGDDLIINLASNEYSGAIKPKNMLNVDFKEIKNGVPKTIGLFAKKARGMMARYIIVNEILAAEKIKNFNEAGYKFNYRLSSESNFVFTRKTA